MKISRANANGSLVRDHVSRVVSDAVPGRTYGARCTLSLKNGKIVRLWAIFTLSTRRKK